jgi:phospholipase A1
VAAGGAHAQAAQAQAQAQAPAAPASLAECHGIASDRDRLACYDKASGRALAPPAETAAPAVVAPKDTATPLANAQAQRGAPTSMIDYAWDFDADSPRYNIRFYKENYFLVGRYTNDVNTAPFVPLYEAIGGPPENLNNTEAKFQLSFKGRLWTTDDRRFGLWAAYTQQNQWQVYNGDASRPFRETNYMPELFVSYRPDVDLGGGFRWKLVNFGYNHQSNGRTDVISRSWNRILASFGAESGNLALFADVWYRIPEKDEEDDNPDISDYYGHGMLSGLYRWRGHSFAGWLRGNVGTGKGAVQVGWTSPPFFGPLRAYVQFFSGYGESLIDYNWKQTTIGAGVALSDGL